jgi:hypothetical protein
MAAASTSSAEGVTVATTAYQGGGSFPFPTRLRRRRDCLHLSPHPLLGSRPKCPAARQHPQLPQPPEPVATPRHRGSTGTRGFSSRWRIAHQLPLPSWQAWLCIADCSFTSLHGCDIPARANSRCGRTLIATSFNCSPLTILLDD